MSIGKVLFDKILAYVTRKRMVLIQNNCRHSFRKYNMGAERPRTFFLVTNMNYEMWHFNLCDLRMMRDNWYEGQVHPG